MSNGKSRMRAKICSLLYFMIATVMCMGCVPRNEYLVENRSNETIRVSISGRIHGWTVPPCTVISLAPHHGSTIGTPVEVSILDENGRILGSMKTKVERHGDTRYIRELWLSILYEPEGSQQCPEPVEGQYVWEVENTTNRKARVRMGEEEVELASQETQRLGPFPGELFDGYDRWPEVEVLGEGEYSFAAWIRPYAVGDIPSIHLRIMDRKPPETIVQTSTP